MNDDPQKLLERYEPKQVKVINADRQMGTLRFSPCGKLLAAGGHDGAIHRWDASSDDLAALPPLTGHGGWVQNLVFHPDGQRLISADSWGQLRCWSVADKEPKTLWSVPNAHDGWIHGLALSVDGRYIVTGGNDRVVRVWTADGQKQQEWPGHEQDILSVAVHPDGQSVVSGDLYGVVKRWDLASGKVVRELDAKILYALSRLQDVGGARRLTFDAKGTTLACAGLIPKNGGNVQGKPTILLFDWQSGKLAHTLTNFADGDGYVYDVYFHPAGFIMAVTSGNPGTGKFFFQRPSDAQPFFIMTKMANCHALAVHPNGQRLAIAATNTGSAGNGRQLKDGEYPGNFSPIFIWDMPAG
ncbi:MAG: WD40 repeat domain-containing protein [Gemmataceae bacterium]